MRAGERAIRILARLIDLTSGLSTHQEFHSVIDEDRYSYDQELIYVAIIIPRSVVEIGELDLSWIFFSFSWEESGVPEERRGEVGEGLRI